MKIQPDHFATMKTAFSTLDTEFHRDRYKAAGLSDKRYRWDLLYHAQSSGKLPQHFVCDVLYPYCDDDHIDTALRRIVRPL